MQVLEQLAKQDLNAAQKEIADGLRVEFNVDPDLIGLVIGKNGDNIRRAKDLTGQPTITVDRENGTVRIAGHSKEAVAEARDMLEMQMRDGASHPTVRYVYK